MMKKFALSLIIAVVAITISLGQAGSLDSYFSKYQEDESFTVVNISSSMFAAISGLETDAIDPEVKAILDNITGMKILNKASNGDRYFDEAMQLIKTKGLEELMSIKEKGENIRIYGKSDGSKYLKEVVMLRGDKSNFILMQVQGKLSIEQLGKLSKTLNK
ncbi:MAG TPA: DUF4252 domain-containing protein [Membranihabitans sp.]|nr:DUF4252 domain-containing protein [Membranihabitans sp.]